LGFSKNLKKAYGKRAHSNFIFDYIGSIQELNSSVKGDISQRGFAFVDYSQIDSGLTQDSKSFRVICTLDYIEDWEELEREEYKNRNEKIIRIFLKKLERYYPNITQLVELNMQRLEPSKQFKDILRYQTAQLTALNLPQKHFLELPR
jgi:hypothetical protein